MRRASVLLALLLIAGCPRKKADPAVQDAATAAPSAVPSATTGVGLDGGDGAAQTATAANAPEASAPVVLDPIDAGLCACRLLYGPAQQPFTGDALLIPTPGGVEVVTNRHGLPSIASAGVGGERPVRAPLATEAEKASWPPCVVAGEDFFCADSSGAITRSRGSAARVMGRAVPGSRLAAAVLGEAHAALAYLGPHKSTEGVLSQAFLIVDERAPDVLSEDGSGATFVTLARRGAEVVALYVDARMAMTPVHVRMLAWHAGAPAISQDAVIFVGGTPEHRTAAALATPVNGVSYGLVPIAGESGFGMATVRIDVQPRDDEPTVWSLYPNGLDPAPLAATASSSPMRIARVRHAERAAGSTHVLELGKLDDAGAFVSQGIIPTIGSVTNVAVAIDLQGALWVHYTDTAGSWLERRSCP